MEIFGDVERLIDDVYPYRWLIAVLVVVAIPLFAAVAYRRGWHLAIARHKLRTALVVVPLLVVMTPLAWYLLSPLWTRTTVYEESPLVAAGTIVPGVAAPTSTTGVRSVEITATATTAPATLPTQTPSSNPADPIPTQQPLGVAEPSMTPLQDVDDVEPTSAPEVEPLVEPTPEPLTEPESEPTPEPEPTLEPEVFTPRLVSSGPLSGADEFHFASGTALLIESAPSVYVLRLEEFSVRNGPDLFVYLSAGPDFLDDAAINLGELRATDGSINYDVPAGIDISQYEGVVIWCRAFAVFFGSAPLISS